MKFKGEEEEEAKLTEDLELDSILSTLRNANETVYSTTCDDMAMMVWPWMIDKKGFSEVPQCRLIDNLD